MSENLTLYDAWVLLANVDSPEIGWPHQTDEWRQATIRFRERFHAQLATNTTLQQRVQKCREVWEVQGAHGNWNSDIYMRAMFNGMELMMSILEGRQPVYRARPKEGYILEAAEIQIVTDKDVKHSDNPYLTPQQTDFVSKLEEIGSGQFMIPPDKGIKYES